MNENNNQITAFNFEGSNVRTAGTAENPLFVAKDVCAILGLENNRRALMTLDEDEKASVTLSDTTSSSRKTVSMNAINEFGLYSLIWKSQKPEAKKFQRWVNHEVLPQIRKTGSYGTPKLPPVFDSATLLQISQEMARVESELEQKQERIEALIPIAQFGNELMDSESLFTATQVSKAIGTGPGILNKFLQAKKVIRSHQNEWCPTHRYQGKVYFHIIVGNRTKTDPITNETTVKTFNQLKFTAKGRELAHRLWREAKA